MSMLPKDTYYKLTIGCILILGLTLRLFQYESVPPFHEINDEVMYPWAGMSLLQTGIPTSWSGVSTYKDIKTIKAWGRSYTVVTPWIHKPLLYPLITGGTMLLTGAKEFDQLRFSKLRLIPIAFNCFSILLIAIVASRMFDRSVGIVSSLFYASIPTIVIGGRLSVIECVLIPTSMLVLLLSSSTVKRIPESWHPYLYGILSILAIQLKQVGIYIAIACILQYFLNRRYKNCIIVLVFTLLGILIYIGSGYYYVGLDEFFRLNFALSKYHSTGAPQVVNIIFRNALIFFKANPFSDPFILIGHLLLFTSPFWLPKIREDINLSNQNMLMLLPFTYIIILQLAESGSARIYGWHFYPLFPFICILLGITWVHLYEKGTFLQILATALAISPIFIWIYKLHPTWLPYWRPIILFSLIIITGISYNERLRKIGLIISLIALVTLNTEVIFGQLLFFGRAVQPSYPN